jgi:hypothetical protein
MNQSSRTEALLDAVGAAAWTGGAVPPNHGDWPGRLRAE